MKQSLFRHPGIVAKQSFQRRSYRGVSFVGRCWPPAALVRFGGAVNNPSSCNKQKFHSNAIISNHAIAGASPRQMADLEERVWSAVTANVKDPELDYDLRRLGWMNRRLAVSKSKDGGETIQILLHVPSLLHPTLDDLKDKVRQEAELELEIWMKQHNLAQQNSISIGVEALPKPPVPWLVEAGQQDQDEVTSRLGPGLANVSHFLAVYSCKGGVGKSTVAVNLAYELARLGGRVGLLDVDIYGPSLPVLVRPDDLAVRRSPLGASMVYPIEHKGVKMLSLGFVSSNSGVPGSGKDGTPAILRGPMVGRVTTQLLKGTDWGSLDVLILDLPPGTGDVQLTVCQEVDLSCAVGVTTPSKLAITDSKKGIAMFSALGINTIAVVENMSYFECDAGVKHYPFGKGFLGDSKTANLRNEEQLDPERICQLPISEIANEANETGIPLCLSRPAEARNELSAFEKLAQIVSRELFRLPYQVPQSEGTVVIDEQEFDLTTIQLSQDKESLVVRFFSESGALQKRITPLSLRSRDPKTGQPLAGAQDVDDTPFDETGGGMATIHKASKMSDIVPQKVEKKAKVGYEVTWSDGSRFIYSRVAIACAAGGKLLY
ncbi:ATP/GTP-binding protein [Nitzschia inconspicua]|uniref:ATP/GTP-binding protein n=1 Tax=Nitzschia inconspicua TaxID=303405 RepID=A0A9K3PGW1_9STRA|nr:ATP/GTP-binding protein [Nitzschia inconspicua]